MNNHFAFGWFSHTFTALIANDSLPLTKPLQCTCDLTYFWVFASWDRNRTHGNFSEESCCHRIWLSVDQMVPTRKYLRSCFKDIHSLSSVGWDDSWNPSHSQIICLTISELWRSHQHIFNFIASKKHSLIEDIVFIFDQPFPNWSIIIIFFCCKLFAC